jgi:choline-sulfatase
MPAPKPAPPGVAAQDAERGPSHKGDYRWLFPARERMNAQTLPWPRFYDDMPGTFTARRALKFLEENRSGPFALWVSFPEPHAPHRFPLDLGDGCRAEQVRVPPIGPDDGSQIPLTFRDVTEGEFRGGIAAYYNSVRFLDRNVGEVLDGLRRLGLEENTLVVYTADHGFCLGHHGRWEKHCGYDQALHVPLLMKWPGRIRRGTVSAMVESVDIPHTILDLLGVDPLPVRHGTSLRAYLERSAAPDRKFVFSEYLENEEAYVRTARWKFIHSSGRRARGDGYETDRPTPGRYTRLFDLTNDPNEFRNVADSQPGAVRELSETMLQRFRATHPDAASEPGGMTREQSIDWYLRPRDV